MDPEVLAEQSGPYPGFDGVELYPKVTLYQDEETENPTCLLRVELKHYPSEDSSFPYNFDVVLEGVFTLELDAEQERAERLFLYNGASMLYSSAREQLLTLSSRHIYGPIMLPSLNFQNLKTD